MNYDSVCRHCHYPFAAKRPGRKYCSLSCASSANMAKKSRQARVQKTCQGCGSQFEVINSYAYMRFCGATCARTVRRNGLPAESVKTCEACGVEFKVQHKLRAQRFCNRSCASSHGWNLGLRAATCEKLREIGQRGGATRAALIVSGQISPVTRGRTSSHVSNKIVGGTCLCRSSYEKRYCELLDLDKDVVAYEAEPFAIEYVLDGVRRRYIPDFLVTLSGNRQRLVEVKPAALVDSPANTAKAAAARRWCEQSGIAYTVVTEGELR